MIAEARVTDPPDDLTTSERKLRTHRAGGVGAPA